VDGLVAGAVNARPFLIRGDDSDPSAPGLQPAPGACTGGM
jgi:hypothetical protein